MDDVTKQALIKGCHSIADRAQAIIDKCEGTPEACYQQGYKHAMICAASAIRYEGTEYLYIVGSEF